MMSPQMSLRMTLARALASELVRLRRSPLLALHGVLALAVGTAAGLYFATASWDPYLACDAFVQLLGAGAPLLVGLSCGLAMDAERAAGDAVNLLGAVSRPRAALAKGLVLLALGALAATLALSAFAVCMLAFGRQVLPLPALAGSVAGITAGSAGVYVIGLAIALVWGRNAAIGVGAIGLVVSFMSIGGLANGLVTGTLSGAMTAGAIAWVPLVWPLRLGSLVIECAIAALGTAAGAMPGLSAAATDPAMLAALTGLLGQTAVACAVGTVLLLVAGLLGIARYQDARRTGE